MGRQLEITRALHAILEKSFPEEYAARRQETLEEAAEDDASSLTVPLFVMQCIMPGVQSLLLAFSTMRTPSCTLAPEATFALHLGHYLTDNGSTCLDPCHSPW